jgi:curved DNA-binding protein CbpA
MPGTETDYYAILEVSPSATQSEIKRSYRRLARKYHPDLNQQARDQHIKLLNEAYKILSDPPQRATYDQQRLIEASRREAAQEALRQQQEQAKQEPRMTWIEGIFGFIKELRRELKEP